PRRGRGGRMSRTAATSSDGADLDRDVASRGLRVRAELVSTVDGLLRGLSVDIGDGHLALDRQAEALALLADAHLSVDAGLRRVDALFLARHAQSGLEAAAVADGEELLGVGSAARSALLLGGAQVHVDHLVVRGTVSVTSTGDLCLRGVGDALRCVHSLLLLVMAEVGSAT